MFNKRKPFVAPKAGKAFDILVASGTNPETVLLFFRGEPIPDDAKLKKGQRLELVEVTTSG